MKCKKKNRLLRAAMEKNLILSSYRSRDAVLSFLVSEKKSKENYACKPENFFVVKRSSRSYALMHKSKEALAGLPAFLYVPAEKFIAYQGRRIYKPN